MKALAAGLALSVALVVGGFWAVEGAGAPSNPTDITASIGAKGDRMGRAFPRPAAEGPLMVAYPAPDWTEALIRTTLAYADPGTASLDPFRPLGPGAAPGGLPQVEDEHEPDEEDVVARPTPEPAPAVLSAPPPPAPRAGERPPLLAMPLPRARPRTAPPVAAPIALIPARPAPKATETTPGVRLASLTPPTAAPQSPSVLLKTPFGVPYVLQTASVEMSCVKPELLALLRKLEAKYGKKVVVTSAFRPNGRPGSLHRTCDAVDFIIPGVASGEVARFARTIPGAGGVGIYCRSDLVHLDTGTPRDWKYGCGSYFALRD